MGLTSSGGVTINCKLQARASSGPVLSQPRDQQAHRSRRGSKGGRPVSYDRELYKRRNVVEGPFALLKQWRGLATRYDKHALICCGAVVLAAVLSWART
jgi:transposase